MPKKNRVAVYSYLFKEGVMTVEKDPRLPKHHILDVPNIHVLDALKSLKSKNHVKEVFNWQWHYYFLTDTGVEYLRQYLQLPEIAVPATLKKPAKPITVRGDDGPRRGGFGRGGDRGDRPRFGGEGYRREGGFAAAAAPAAPAVVAAAPAAAL